MLLLGISRIEYRPWKGERTDPGRRFLVITWQVFRKNIRAKSIIAVLIFGMLFAHAFPIISALIFPHEDVRREDFIGPADFEPPPDVNITGPESHFNVTGGLEVNTTLMFDGTFYVDGLVYVDQNLWLNGTIEGMGSLVGDGGLFQEGLVNISGQMHLQGYLDINGSITGYGLIRGYGIMNGSGWVNGIISEPPVIEPDEFDGEFGRGLDYFNSYVYAIFAMLLAAIACAALIAEDLADSSFVMYFSRPVRSIDYLLGKFTGAACVMGLYTLIPPLIYVLVMIGTQSGSDYSGEVKLVGLTLVAGVFTAVFFLPFGLMISSFTKRKAYAGIGIFMSFFVLFIVGGIFRTFNDKWILIDPVEVLHATYVFLFGGHVSEVSGPEVAASLMAFTLIPSAVVFFWVHRKEVGK